jgi:hypothetical protein
MNMTTVSKQIWKEHSMIIVLTMYRMIVRKNIHVFFEQYL